MPVACGPFSRECHRTEGYSEIFCLPEAFLDDLQQSLDKFEVPEAEQAEIKAIIDSTRSDIVV
jgi:hypothetical protein